MKIVRGFGEQAGRKWKNIISIGSFDGIHRGHKVILENLLKLAGKYRAKSTIITFDPLPKEFFQKGTFKVISTLDEKLKVFEEYGIDVVCIIPFTKKFSQIEPLDFLNKIWKYFSPYAIVVGYNHHFGKDGMGGVSLLEDFSIEKGIYLRKVEEVKLGALTVSSSRIRHLIAQGDIKRANEMLGRKFFFSAVVNKGRGIGRILSYPTANLSLDLPNKIIPKEGVYAAKAFFDSRIYGAMLYFGRRPTFSDEFSFSCELYIMEFKGNLYGKEITVRIVDRIREEKKFHSAQNLKSQIINDEEAARKIISNSVSKQGG
ncbi:MAG: bifunctional riboflavin kinase/FAD synthetase [Candidatus Cloacimonadota bacterium]|nr:MAG: bifunctional riboflavin kinase/FAD synthetase [Candidatus Cloacimonadota bacterium]